MRLVSNGIFRVVDEEIKFKISAKDRIPLGVICLFFGLIGVFTVNAEYKEMRNKVSIEKVTVPLADGKCRATSDLSVKGQKFSNNEVLEKKYCGRSGYPIEASEIRYIRQSGAENVSRVVRFALGAAFGAIVFSILLQIKPKLKFAFNRAQSSITTIDSSKVQTPRETTNGDKEVPKSESPTGYPNHQQQLIVITRLMQASAAVLFFLGFVVGLFIGFTPECTLEESSECLERDWANSMTYGLTLMFVNAFIMGFVIMITQYIIWRIDKES